MHGRGRADTRSMKAFAALLLLATALSPCHAAPTYMPGEAALPAPKSVREEAFRSSGDDASVRSARLAPLAAPIAGRLDALSEAGEKRVALGIPRTVGAELLDARGWSDAPSWTPAAGGRATRIEVSSPGAASLRLALRANALPASAEIRVRGSDGRTVGPIGAEAAVAATLDRGAWWTPLTEGATQSVEIWIPASADPTRVRFAVETLSHLEARPSALFKTAGSCHEDVVCHSSGNPALANAARSVAKLVYTENGVTYLCSGTLINSGNGSQIPYLYTAAHCIGTQAAAATLNTFWFFDAAACSGKATSDYRQLAGGATLLYANADTDAALVRLAERAPDGAWFAGWDVAPLSAGTALVGLHHPGGELKKIAMGQAMEATASASGSYATAAWLAGTTEKGSSGSGIFSLANGEYVLRGGLKGGSASCESSGRVADPANRDYYSRLDLEGAKLRTWLAAGPAPLEDYTDMWWNPDEPGWGLSIQQHADNRVFVTHYSYDRDGKPAWLVIPEAKWMSATTIEGVVYRATGPSPDGPYDAKKFSVTPVGSARIVFGDAGTASMSLTADGRTSVKPVRRQAF